MKEKRIHTIGKWLCIVGVALLVIAILIVFLEGSFFAARLILASMLLNTVGIVMLRYEEEPKS